jgi:hypothetical protein
LEHDQTEASLKEDLPFLKQGIAAISQSMQVVASLCSLISHIFQIQEDMAYSLEIKLGKLIE